MKARTILLFLFFILFTTVTYAQRFHGGILVGLNASQIDGDTWAGFYKGGLVSGAFVNTDLKDKWSGQLEIKFSSKGSAPHPDSKDYPMKIKLNYIDLPILARYEAVSNLNIEGGLSINYLFLAKVYNGAWVDVNKETIHKVEAALAFGVNYQFFKRFDFNIRYNYSLLPARSEYSGSTWGEGAWYNQVINFALYFHLSQNAD